MAATPLDGRARAQTRLRWELLTGLVSKDLKVKYQGSALGFLWSLANPLLLLVVYTFVFQLVLRTGIPQFGFYLLSGLLVWNFVAGSIGAACSAVVGNAGLVKKVRFPLAVLPLTAVGFAGVHFVLQLMSLIVVMLVIGYDGPFDADILMLFPALVVAVVFAIAISFLVSALNVRYRDTQHIVEIGLTAGFWVVPIVYSVSLVQDTLGDGLLFDLYFLNPMAGVVTAMQRALYGQNPPLPGGGTVLASDGYAFYLERLGVGLIVSLALMALAWRVYHRLSADFAEDL